MAHGLSLSAAFRLALIPAVITLGVTLLRLFGELNQWSELFFNRQAGGPGALIGIVWLVPVFGAYFAIRLNKQGLGTARPGRAIGLAVLGFMVLNGGIFMGFGEFVEFPGRMAVGFAIALVGVLMAYYGWPELGKTLLVYGILARIPVVIIMFLAIRGAWGTHYDALPPNFPSDTPFWSTFFMIGLLPQLTLWIGFTIVVGSLVGGIVGALVGRRRAQPVEAAST